MPNPLKVAFLENLRKRFGIPRKLENSESLFEIADGKARFYFRYSRKHPRNRTFFGLRKVDLQLLEGHNAFICFFASVFEEVGFIHLLTKDLWNGHPCCAFGTSYVWSNSTHSILRP